MKTLTITFFLTMVFSTGALSFSPVPDLKVVHDRVHEIHKHIDARGGLSPRDKEWNQVCQRDVSCKWEGNRCTFKSDSVMRYHCETTTRNWANVVIQGRSLMNR